MDVIEFDPGGSEPSYTIAMRGLAEICFAFEGADEQRGTNTEWPQFTFALPLSKLNGSVLSLVGVAADYNGGSVPYLVTLTVEQGSHSIPVTIVQPLMSGGTATFSASVRFIVQ